MHQWRKGIRMRFKPARRNGLRVQIPPDALFLRIVQGTEYQATNREPQVRFLLWRLMSEWRNGRRGILKISFLRIRIPLPTLCRCIRKAQEPALEAGGEQLAGSNPAAGTTKKEGNDPSFSYVFNYVRQTGFRCNCIHGSGCHIFRQA